jgi:hypothetical protein
VGDVKSGEYVTQIEGFTTPTGKFLAARAGGHTFTGGAEEGIHS